MADFAIWACAAAPACDWRLVTSAGEITGAEAFMEAYNHNQGEAVSVALETSTLARAVCTLAETAGRWEGSYLDLLTVLTRMAGVLRHDNEWPKTPRKLSAALRRLMPLLRDAGVLVDFPSTDNATAGAGREPGNGRRRVIVRKQEIEKNSHHSHNSHTVTANALMLAADIGGFSNAHGEHKHRVITGSVEESLVYLNNHGAHVEYYPEFLSRTEVEHYWKAVFAGIEFNSDEASQVRLPFSREKVAIPRRQTAYGDPDTTYTFTGCVVPARPWIPILVELRELLQHRTGYTPNFVLINHYRSGSDHIGWHADDERDLGNAPDILSLSLGAERDFQFRHRDAFPRAKRPPLRPDLKTVTIPLSSGSLLIMRDPTNKNWKHQLPRRGGKQAQEIGDRLNLTWRRIVV
jgi:alpha-ketoglutarate-dependent dioxygenase alkB family protein 2